MGDVPTIMGWGGGEGEGAGTRRRHGGQDRKYGAGKEKKVPSAFSMTA